MLDDDCRHFNLDCFYIADVYSRDDNIGDNSVHLQREYCVQCSANPLYEYAVSCTYSRSGVFKVDTVGCLSSSFPALLFPMMLWDTHRKYNLAMDSVSYNLGPDF